MRPGTRPAGSANRRGRRRRWWARSTVDQAAGRAAPAAARQPGQAPRGAGAQRGARSLRPGSAAGLRSGHARAPQTRTPAGATAPRGTAAGRAPPRPPARPQRRPSGQSRLAIGIEQGYYVRKACIPTRTACGSCSQKDSEIHEIHVTVYAAINFEREG
jgi:hypothetical protein